MICDFLDIVTIIDIDKMDFATLGILTQTTNNLSPKKGLPVWQPFLELTCYFA